MKPYLLLIAPLVIAGLISCRHTEKINTDYVDSFENINHPEVAYWFFSPSMMPEERYKGKIDTFSLYSKYTLVYLTARDGCDFYNVKTMHPVFERLVAYAHQKGLKIGLQIWKNNDSLRIENTDRLIQESELVMDDNGSGKCTVKPKGARSGNSLLKSELFKVFAFRKTDDGFYDPSTLKEITGLSKATGAKNELRIAINAGRTMKGMTAYIMTQHFYNSCSNFSGQAMKKIKDIFKAYSDVPFDAIGLDEYKNMTIARAPDLIKNNDVFRERLYSVGMNDRMKASVGMDLDRVLFDMRYAPEGNPSVRMKAINEYMSLLRTATLNIEAEMYNSGKQLYGKNTFIGLHNTFHNNIDGDEVWQTGVSWWNIKRDYGHTDEETITPVQIGIGMSNKMNAMYNMYYNSSIERIWTKALYDLRFGIRTHYHAANDGRVWGVSIEKPEALEKINKVENCARLLNRFNPPFPGIKLLVVYGMEAIYDWYPDLSNRGLYDINDKLEPEKKSAKLWEEGYLNAGVPTDVIEDGRLKLNEEGKPIINGYTFDAVVFIGPEYSKKITTKFFQDYVNKGGKLLIDGTASHDYDGTDNSAVWKEISSKAVASSFSLDNVEKLGVSKNELVDGVANEEGSYTFTSIESLKNNARAVFTFRYKGNTYSGTYKGLAAIRIDTKGKLEKVAATSLYSVKKNGREILHLSSEADIFLTAENGIKHAVVADKNKSINVYINE